MTEFLTQTHVNKFYQHMQDRRANYDMRIEREKHNMVLHDLIEEYSEQVDLE